MVPLIGAALVVGAAVRLALVAETVAIATMKAIDNAVMPVISDAMEAPLASPLVRGSLVVALAIAAALLANRRPTGCGHVAVHAHQ